MDRSTTNRLDQTIDAFRTAANAGIRNQIEAIRGDPSNPKHDKFLNNDPDTVREVTELYKSLTGGK